MRLAKAVYGLAARGRLWWQLFVCRNKEFRMEPLTDDETMFIAKKGWAMLIVVIVVDDCLMTGYSEGLLKEWLEFMLGFFTISDDGELKYYLGIKFKKLDNCWKAVQDAYLDRCLAAKYKLQDSKMHPTQWTQDLPSQKTR